MQTASSTRSIGPGDTSRIDQPSGPAAAAEQCAVVARYGVGELRGLDQAIQLHRRLAVDGLALYSGIHGPQGLLKVAAEVMDVVPHPDSDLRGVTTLSDRGRAGDQPNAAGFSRRALLPHTDRSGVADPAALLMITCASPSGSGGACLLVDGKSVLDDLTRTAPPAVTALLCRRSVRFGGVDGYLGSILADVSATSPSAATGDGVRRMIRLRLDGLAMHCPQVALWLPALRAAIDRHTLTIELGAGDGYLLDNHRWLHGRTAYHGPRTLHRLHGNPRPELHFQPGIPLDRIHQPGADRLA